MPQHLGWIAAICLTAVAVIIIIVQSRRAARLQRDLSSAVRQGEEHKAAAARLPDALQRVAAAERNAQGVSDSLRGESARAAALDARLQSAVAARQESVLELEVARRRLEEQQSDMREQIRVLTGDLAQATAERDAARREVGQVKEFLEKAQVQLRDAIGEVAGRVFEERGAALSKSLDEAGARSRESLDAAIKPFMEQIAGMRDRAEQVAIEQVRDQAQLVGAINKVHELNSGLMSTAESLVKALKGNAKIRGDWGEMVLDTVLRASGLEEPANYERQVSGRDEDTGKMGRPDVVLKMPDGRRLAVDSKVNLVAWADMHNAETPEQAEDAKLRHAAALRAHMRDLASKNYPKIIGGEALDLTILFVPIEGALAAALATNPDLQSEAWSKGITFASPNTLMAMLKVVERLWTRDKLQRQIEHIGTEAGKMLDSVVLFLEDFNSIEGRLAALDTAVRSARNRLSESPQSVIARARRMTTAGAKGKKVLPEELLPDAGHVLTLEASPADDSTKLLVDTSR